MNPNPKLTEPPELASQLSTLAERWEAELEGMSSTARMSQHPAYQETIQMRYSLIQLITLTLSGDILTFTALPTVNLRESAKFRF